MRIAAHTGSVVRTTLVSVVSNSWQHWNGSATHGTEDMLMRKQNVFTGLTGTGLDQAS